MGTFAVTLAGLTATTNTGVLEELKHRFSDGYVFRGRAARASGSSLVRYNAIAVDNILEAARDAVFGSTRRPSGFCRHPDGGCALDQAGKARACGKSGGQACYKRKPDFLIVFFQEGEDEAVLFERLQYCALLRRIPRGLFERRSRIVEYVAASLDEVRRTLSAVKEEFTTRFTPLLLPPMNFSGNNIKTLLHEASMSNDFKKGAREFRSLFYSKEKKAFVGGKGKLLFTPAYNSIRHGQASDQDRADLALTNHHRMGCGYERRLQFDVTRSNGSDFDGTKTFKCRRSGDQRPTGTHVNISVDDCLI